MSKSKPAVVEPLTMGWKRWAALSLVNGHSLAEVVATMVADGIDEVAAATACARFFDEDGAFEAARWLAEQLKKLESILTVRQQLEALGHVGTTIDRRQDLSRDEFLVEYYARNTPVILTDVCGDWPARSLWTVDYLTKVLGHAEVEVMANRDADPTYEIEADNHRRVMTFGAYAAKVAATDWSNDTYLVANNEFLSSSVADPLWSDFSADPRYLLPDQRGGAYLWFGPAGTVTPLHHDALSVLFNQVVGRKRFRLISPLATHLLYNNLSVYSDVDPLAVDHERFPLFKDARQLSVVLEPGETLFLPVGWWHHVEACDLSLSVSFTNFVFPNDVDIFDPTIQL